MKANPNKLTLNQETLRNLTPNELQNVVGGFNSHSGCISGFPVSCPECNPPARN